MRDRRSLHERIAPLTVVLAIVLGSNLSSMGVLAGAVTSRTAHAVAPPSTAANAVTQATPTPAARVVIPASVTARQRRIFRTLWTTVNARYLYPDFNGFDWNGARTKMNKRIAAGMTDQQFYDSMRDLIFNLNDDHSNFLSPDEAKAEDDEYDGVGTYIGVGIMSDVNPDKRYLYVLTVLPDSPAEKAGIRPHDQVLAIDGEPAVNEQGESQSSRLRGTSGTTVTLQVRTPGQQPRVIELQRGQVTSVERIDYRLLPGAKRTGYVNIPSLFEENVLSRVREGMRELMKEGELDGLILDLRTNGGGTYGNLRGLLSLFSEGEMGKLVTRTQVVNPVRVHGAGIGNSQRVPLLVLVGPSTESYAEVLAGALQAAGRAKLIGQNTAGNIETLLSHEFEDGSRLWLAEETFHLPDGSSWEGAGLTPDIRIEANWDEYTVENDPVLAEALKYFGF